MNGNDYFAALLGRPIIDGPELTIQPHVEGIIHFSAMACRPIHGNVSMAILEFPGFPKGLFVPGKHHDWWYSNQWMSAPPFLRNAAIVLHEIPPDMYRIGDDQVDMDGITIDVLRGNPHRILGYRPTKAPRYEWDGSTALPQISKDIIRSHAPVWNPGIEALIDQALLGDPPVMALIGALVATLQEAGLESWDGSRLAIKEGWSFLGGRYRKYQGIPVDHPAFIPTWFPSGVMFMDGHLHFEKDEEINRLQ